METIESGEVFGVIINNEVHVLNKGDKGSYHLFQKETGPLGVYPCCCCGSSHTKFDVVAVVHQAKKLGATAVVMRDPSYDSVGNKNCRSIDGLPFVEVRSRIRNMENHPEFRIEKDSCLDRYKACKERGIESVQF